MSFPREHLSTAVTQIQSFSQTKIFFKSETYLKPSQTSKMKLLAKAPKQPPEVFVRKCVPATLLKKRRFPVNFAKFQRTTFKGRLLLKVVNASRDVFRTDEHLRWSFLR